MSRWIPILARTPSGKSQFVCRYCGRTTVVPDKECRIAPALATGGLGKHPDAGLKCQELEKRDRQVVTASITWNAIFRSENLMARLRSLSDTEAVALIRKDRALLFDLLMLTAEKVCSREGNGYLAQHLSKALEYMRTELCGK